MSKRQKKKFKKKMLAIIAEVRDGKTNKNNQLYTWGIEEVYAKISNLNK